jgi:hypothetical protein
MGPRAPCCRTKFPVVSGLQGGRGDPGAANLRGRRKKGDRKAKESAGWGQVRGIGQGKPGVSFQREANMVNFRY